MMLLVFRFGSISVVVTTRAVTLRFGFGVQSLAVGEADPDCWDV